MTELFPLKLLSATYNWNSLMITEHWFRQWLSIVRPSSASLHCFTKGQWVHHTARWGHILARPWHMMFLFCLLYRDDVIKWKHFPRYWPFVMGTRRAMTSSCVSVDTWCDAKHYGLSSLNPVTYLCISELDLRWFISWLGACLSPSHELKRAWCNVKLTYIKFSPEICISRCRQQGCW